MSTTLPFASVLQAPGRLVPALSPDLAANRLDQAEQAPCSAAGRLLRHGLSCDPPSVLLCSRAVEEHDGKRVSVLDVRIEDHEMQVQLIVSPYYDALARDDVSRLAGRQASRTNASD